MKKPFKPGEWEKIIDVRDFLFHNQTPYDGGPEFLKGPSKKTKELWDLCKILLKKENTDEINFETNTGSRYDITLQ